MPRPIRFWRCHDYRRKQCFIILVYPIRCPKYQRYLCRRYWHAALSSNARRVIFALHNRGEYGFDIIISFGKARTLCCIICHADAADNAILLYQAYIEIVAHKCHPKLYFSALESILVDHWFIFSCCDVKRKMASTNEIALSFWTLNGLRHYWRTIHFLDIIHHTVRITVIRLKARNEKQSVFTGIVFAAIKPMRNQCQFLKCFNQALPGIAKYHHHRRCWREYIIAKNQMKII